VNELNEERVSERGEQERESWQVPLKKRAGGGGLKYDHVIERRHSIGSGLGGKKFESEKSANVGGLTASLGSSESVEPLAGVEGLALRLRWFFFFFLLLLFEPFATACSASSSSCSAPLAPPFDPS